MLRNDWNYVTPKSEFPKCQNSALGQSASINRTYIRFENAHGAFFSLVGSRIFTNIPDYSHICVHLPIFERGNHNIITRTITIVVIILLLEPSGGQKVLLVGSISSLFFNWFSFIVKVAVVPLLISQRQGHVNDHPLSTDRLIWSEPEYVVFTQPTKGHIL